MGAVHGTHAPSSQLLQNPVMSYSGSNHWDFGISGFDHFIILLILVPSFNCRDDGPLPFPGNPLMRDRRAHHGNFIMSGFCDLIISSLEVGLTIRPTGLGKDPRSFRPDEPESRAVRMKS
jgi:hypothetical protein